ncbi:MAG TPA: DUF2336 domain-containing protein [Bauldia sp.]|nr:DUF2336 domain-containing protein [Bauldia sp.]
MQPKELTDGLPDGTRANERKRDSALLRATAELFVLDVIHDRDEIRRFEEITTHFLPKVSPADRTFVAERLAIAQDAPASIIRALARDVIEVAAPVLKHSTVLGPIDLLAIIAATGAEHHRLIARRTHLSPEVIRALRLTGDATVIAKLDQAPAAIVPKTTAVEHAIDTSAAAATAEVGSLYRSNRLDPWRFLSLDRPSRLRLIADIASRPPPLAYAAPSTKLDRAFRSILSAAQIVGYARSGQVGPIIAAIADGLGLPSTLVTAALNDHSGDLFAIMLKALRLDDVQARQVLLLVAPSGRDVRAFFPLSDLYGGMEPSVAETLVGAWRSAVASGKEVHEPHLAPNGERYRPTGVEAPRPSASNPQEQAKRA